MMGTYKYVLIFVNCTPYTESLWKLLALLDVEWLEVKLTAPKLRSLANQKDHNDFWFQQ